MLQNVNELGPTCHMLQIAYTTLIFLFNLCHNEIENIVYQALLPFPFQINGEKKRTGVGREKKLKRKILFSPSQPNAVCLVSKLRVKNVACGI